MRQAVRNNVCYDVVIKHYEDENAAILEKAKLESEGTIDKYYINPSDLVTGAINMQDDNGEIVLQNEEAETVAVVDVDTFIDEIPVGTVGDRIVYGNTISLGNLTVFGQEIDSLGLVDGLDREIENSAEGMVELLNEK